MEANTCYICGKIADIRQDRSHEYDVICTTCGSYTADHRAKIFLPNSYQFLNDRRHILSGLTRRKNILCNKNLMITREFVDKFEKDEVEGIPKSVFEKIDNLLLCMKVMTKKPGDSFQVGCLAKINLTFQANDDIVDMC